MSVTLELLHVVEQAHSLARILEGASRVIAKRLRVDGCFVFLLDQHGRLVRSDADGSDPSGRSPPADAEAASIAAQAFAERRAAAARGRTTSLLASPMLLRDSAVGAVVLQSAVRRDYSAEEIGTLATISAQLVGIVENVAAGYVDPFVGGGTKDFAPYVLMILALMVRPYGMFGKRIIERV